MRWERVATALVMVCLLVTSGWGQPGSSENDELQKLIRILQAKAKTDDSSMSGSRVTRLGSERRYQEEEEEVVVRIYDLSDLFAIAPPYPATVTGPIGGDQRPLFPAFGSPDYTGSGMGGMGMGGMGAGMFNVRSKLHSAEGRPRHVLPQVPAGSMNGAVEQASGAMTPRTSIEGLVDAITTTIAPTEWDSVGGPGSIAILGNELLISATEATHGKILALLDTFRKRWGTLRTISLRAHWLWLTEAQLAPLLATDAKPKADEVKAYGLVNEAAWKARNAQLEKPDPARPAGYRAVVTCYNGQTVHTVSGEQSMALMGMIPVLDGGKGAEIAYQPIVGTIQQGAALQVTPISSISGKFIVVDVHSQVVRMLEQPRNLAEAEQGRNIESGARDVASVIDRPTLMNHRLATTLRFPIDRRMLVGGMTYKSEPRSGDPDLYLFMKVSMQELRDDVSQRPESVQPKPAPQTKGKK